MSIGLSEIILIGLVVLALFKPEKLKEYAIALGRAIRYLKDEKEKIDDSVITPVKEAMEPVNDIKRDIDDTIDSIKETLTTDNKNEKKLYYWRFS